MLKIFIFFLLTQFSTHLLAQSQADLQRMRELASKFDISESWRAAKVFSPNSSNSTSVDKLNEFNPINVVVHLHGCGGIGKDEIEWAKYLSKNNFYVVLPDSLAIPNRKSNCDPKSNIRNAHNVPVGPLRVSEARFAIEQIEKISSVKKVFLMGHSEGGATILLAQLSKFSGVISIGSFCSGAEVRVDKQVPLLLINYQSDPWFKDIKYLCSEKTAHRKENTVELILSGSGHEASNNKEAQKNVLEFLENQLK